jgi:hypothetical protein
MRVFILCCTTLLCTTACHAQLEKGTWLLGGSGKFFSYKSQYSTDTYVNESNYTQIDISSNIGLFLIEKLGLGIRPTLSSFKGGTTDGGIGSNIKRYWIGPFMRYYFLEKDRESNIIGDLSYQVGFLRGISRGSLSRFSCLAGPVLFFNSSVAIEFLVGYSYNKEDIQQASKEIQKGFQVAIGFQIHLEK